MTAHVILRNVTKRFGSVVAVDNLTLDIARGECLSLLGPSGCGKTTTLRMLAGFEDLDEGEILVGGRVISSSYKNYYLPPERRDFGMVFQAFAVWPHLNVYENVAFPLRIRGMSRAEIRQRTERALTDTGLLAVQDSYPHQLSGGQKQRVALARSSPLIRQSCSWMSPSPTWIPRCGRKCGSRSKNCRGGSISRSST